MRTCRTCGAELTERTRRARYCDDRCRVRYARGHRPPPVVEAQLCTDVHSSWTEVRESLKADPAPVDDDADYIESWDDVAALHDLDASTPAVPRRASRDW